MELLGTPLWDKINNIQTWLLKYPREFEFTKTMTKYDYQQFIESRGR
jgi:hypothetical protein